jgi:hypothetical protein
MEVIRSKETFVSTSATRRHIPQGGILLTANNLERLHALILWVSLTIKEIPGHTNCCKKNMFISTKAKGTTKYYIHEEGSLLGCYTV